MESESFSGRVLGGLNEEQIGYVLTIVELVKNAYCNYRLKSPFPAFEARAPLLTQMLCSDCFLEWNLISQCMISQDLFISSDDSVYLNEEVGLYIQRFLFSAKVLDNLVSLAVQQISACILLSQPKNADFRSFAEHFDYQWIVGVSQPASGVEVLELLAQYPVAQLPRLKDVARQRLAELGLADIFTPDSRKMAEALCRQLQVSAEELKIATKGAGAHFFICFRTDALLRMLRSPWKFVPRVHSCEKSFDALLRCQNISIQQFKQILRQMDSAAQAIGVDFRGLRHIKYNIGEIPVSGVLQRIIEDYMPVHDFMRQFQLFPYDLTEIFVDYVDNTFAGQPSRKIQFISGIRRIVGASRSEFPLFSITAPLKDVFGADFNEIELFRRVILQLQRCAGSQAFSPELKELSAAELRVLHVVNEIVASEPNLRQMYVYTALQCEKIANQSFQQLEQQAMAFLQAEGADAAPIASQVAAPAPTHQPWQYQGKAARSQERHLEKEDFIKSYLDLLKIRKTEQLAFYWTGNEAMNAQICWVMQHLTDFERHEQKFVQALDAARRIAAVEPIRQNFQKVKIVAAVRARIDPYRAFFAEEEVDIDRTALKWPKMIFYRGQYQPTDQFIAQMQRAAEDDANARRAKIQHEQDRQLRVLRQWKQERLEGDGKARLLEYQNAWQKAKFIDALQ